MSEVEAIIICAVKVIFSFFWGIRRAKSAAALRYGFAVRSVQPLQAELYRALPARAVPAAYGGSPPHRYAIAISGEEFRGLPLR